MIFKGQVFKIYPSKLQQERIEQNIKCSNFIYNKQLSKAKQSDEIPTFNINEYLKEFDFLREVPKGILLNANYEFELARKNLNPKYIKFRNNKEQSHYAMTFYGDNFAIVNNELYVKDLGFLTLSPKINFPEGTKIFKVTISRKYRNEYTVSISIKEDNPQAPHKEIKSAIGLDYSPKNLYIDSNGGAVDYPNFFEPFKEKLEREKKKLARMESGSNNYYRQKEKIEKIKDRIKAQRENYLRRLANELTDKYQLICVEDISIIQLGHHNPFIIADLKNSAWNHFVDLLEYKSAEKGGHVVKIEKYFPSSQICSCCGERMPEHLGLAVRQWTCTNCGAQHDRDINAAKNILKEGQKIFYNTYI